jgi:hypothetical protein
VFALVPASTVRLPARPGAAGAARRPRWAEAMTDGQQPHPAWRGARSVAIAVVTASSLRPVERLSRHIARDRRCKIDDEQAISPAGVQYSI